tara:strand:- start:1199 stop:1384 length:186 start_codon:yes stop_codon:yes gene_type:complete
MSLVQNRIKKLKSEHRTLDTEIKRLYNTTHSEQTLKNMKQRKLQLKDEITRLQGENNGKKD